MFFNIVLIILTYIYILSTYYLRPPMSRILGVNIPGVRSSKDQRDVRSPGRAQIRGCYRFHPNRLCALWESGQFTFRCYRY